MSKYFENISFRVQGQRIPDILKSLVISFFVIIGTFPDNDWSFSVGIDPPLSWVFNYLFENGLEIGKHIVFPHGPLAFFMYPLPENVLLATLVTSILKGLLVFNVVWLFSDTKSQSKWLVAFVFAYMVSIIAGFNHLILANILLLYSNSYNSNKKGFKYLAFFITSFAFFVRAYVGIISGVLFFSFVLYQFYNNKNIKQLLVDGAILLGLILTFWVSMYGTTGGFLRYVFGMFQLAQDNSSAAAYYPYNNWLILILFLVAIISFYFLNRTKKASFYVILTSLSLFAAWKHGMAREDIFHVKSLFIYLIICLSVFVMFHRKNSYTNVILSILALFLFSINMKNSVNYYSVEYELFRMNNFIEFVSEFSDLKQESIEKTEAEISVNKLPQNILDSIAKSSVDVYPWDYSIIAANNLNWQPRPVIQSYASYTSWLDKINADHFESGFAPDFLILEYRRFSRGINGGDVGSIDYRYLLNDEPQAILSLLKNYDFSVSESNWLLLKKRTKPLQILTTEISGDESTWGEWMKVPEMNGGFLRAKLSFSKTILQRIKSFIYKDEQFWIYIKLDNGLLHKYRIVPKNAADGLWINPYIANSDKKYTIDEIMFKCSNQGIITNNLKVDWEQIEFINSASRIDEFFDLNEFSTDSILIHSINGYEAELLDNWSDSKAEVISDIPFLGLKSNLVKGNSFSLAFSYRLDSIPFQNLKVTADCWATSINYKYSKEILLVLSVDNKDGNVIWKGMPVDGQIIDQNQWNNIYSFINYNHVIPGCTLKAYIWNKGEEEIIIDDFRILFVKGDELK